MISLKNTFELQAAVLKEGYSFSEFARTIGVSRSCLSKVFSTKRISAKVAKLISTQLNVEFDRFFLISGCPYEHDEKDSTAPPTPNIGGQP